MSRSVAEFRITDKQQEIMTLVVETTARGNLIKVSDLLAQLSYRPARAALHGSLTFLKRHGMIVTESHGRNGSFVKPTAAGMTLFKPKPFT